MMDRRDLRRQRDKVARLSRAVAARDRDMRRTRIRLRRWADALGRTEALSGAFILGGLVGLKTAPDDDDSGGGSASRDASDSQDNGDGQSSRASSGGGSALLRWLNAGLLLWRMQSAAADARTSAPGDGARAAGPDPRPDSGSEPTGGTGAGQAPGDSPFYVD